MERVLAFCVLYNLICDSIWINTNFERCFMALKKKSDLGQVRQQTPLSPSLERQRQVDLGEFKASLFYIVSSRLVRAT